ncbi:hypothetical protein TNCV_3314481 [Trichonephila clavipes]|nr:hypothetical protein TNCV_3314481 [Trichonephila clavipes]
MTCLPTIFVSRKFIQSGLDPHLSGLQDGPTTSLNYQHMPLNYQHMREKKECFLGIHGALFSPIYHTTSSRGRWILDGFNVHRTLCTMGLQRS